MPKLAKPPKPATHSSLQSNGKNGAASSHVKKSTRAAKNPATTPPAYFLSLTVKNFRCFKDEQTLDLSDGKDRPAQWTVLLGDNGVGKTTLLQCLAAMQPKLDSAFKPDEEARVETFYPQFCHSSGYRYHAFRNITAEWFSGPNHTSHFAGLELSVFYNAKLTQPGVGLTCNDLKVKRLGIHGYSVECVEKRDHNIGGLICYGYGATRRMDRAPLNENRDDDTITSLYFDEFPLLNAEDWLLKADYATKASGNPIAIARRDRLTQALISLLPDIQDIKLEQPDEQSPPRLRIETPYGWVSIRDLSLGYRALIAWIVDFATRLLDRYPDSKDPLAEPAVCLVDEIDLHLHPQWQRKVISKLTELFPNTQFIVTAHSPLIVQAAAEANIVLLRREGDHVVIDNDVESIRNWRVDQILTSDLFGLTSARPPQFDEAIEERDRILGKARLTKADREKLKALDRQIADLPEGETPLDIEAMDLIRETAKLIRDGQFFAK